MHTVIIIILLLLLCALIFVPMHYYSDRRRTSNFVLQMVMPEEYRIDSVSQGHEASLYVAHILVKPKRH